MTASRRAIRELRRPLLDGDQLETRAARHAPRPDLPRRPFQRQQHARRRLLDDDERDQLASSNVNLENSIVFSAGCHSGYNIVSNDAVPGVTQTLDWVRGVRPEAGDADRRHRLPVRRHGFPRLQRAAVRGLLPRAPLRLRARCGRHRRSSTAKSTYLDDNPELSRGSTSSRCSRRRCTACRC